MAAKELRVDAGWTLPNLSPSVSLAGGVLHFEKPTDTTEVVEPGFKLVLILEGRLRYSVGERQTTSVHGPAFHMSMSDEPFSLSLRFDPAAPVRYVAVRIPRGSLAEDFGVDAGWLARRAAGSGRLLMDQQADRALQGLGRQLLACPMQGSARRMYLAGKAMELAATVMTGIERDAVGVQGAAAPLSVRDVERLHAARDILNRRLQQPPTLPELARLAGTNVNKLTTGFRQLFGCSVYDFVRGQRLELAYRLIATGGSSAAEAAQACGYTASHFTKAFQKRFGVKPGSLH
ncbi:AraC family transcriptional regulator [Paracidovorax avenae]